ncbi:PE family protein [Mycobacterium sp. E3198]|uniref:PE family protein n=1 Tax=Mycobacterium sp. E3198 TaxID=1834143 RepID=UPI0009ECC6CA|nr:PE family protein [Mycobacterium sp. E3198]
MSFISVVPDVMTAASANLTDIGSSLRAAHAAAVAQTTAIAAPGADEVSAAITSFFGSAGQEFQALGARASAYHDNFVGALNAGLGQYVSAEATNVQQTLASAVNVPAAAAAESINTPFGPVSLTFGGSLPTPPGTPGPFSGFANATNALFGTANITVSGNVLNNPIYGLGTEFQVTGGTFTAPQLLSFLAAGAGPTVSGSASLMNSVNTLIADLQTGNLPGAALALVSAPGNYLAAVTIGSTTVNIPIDTTAYGGPVGTLSIPFEGVFASPQPITASWPTFSVSTGGPTYLVDGVTNLPIGSTSGFVPYLLGGIASLFGL